MRDRFDREPAFCDRTYRDGRHSGSPIGRMVTLGLRARY